MAASPVELVDRAEALPELVKRLAGARAIAVDLESNGLFAYTARLCTLQILDADDTQVIVVDPLKLPDAALAPLAALLGESGPRKLIHDVAFDARILAQHGLPLANVFDTALAARFLGLQATGLGSLAEVRLGQKLSKKMQHHDWGRRPLNREAVEYLAGDVMVMPPLATQLYAEIEAKALGPELEEETRYRLLSAQRDAGVADPRPAYVRMRDAEKLPRPALAVLREVAEVREREARRLGVPPFKVLDNSVLMELAKKPPASKDELSRVRGLQHPRAKALHGALFDAMERSRGTPDIPANERAEFFTPPPKPPRAELTATRQREQRLMVWRKAQAQARGVDEQAILPGHVLRRLAEQAPQSQELLAATAGLGAFRATRDGAALLQAIRGPAPGATP
ncbi:MAG: HRDC domain-containing protein [Deltaproteobacteria bacterium]|nr:HRDC domain-containing protein [Deltaproteobacteria bacterium]